MIQDGAKLVQTPEDILDEIGVLAMRSPADAETPKSAAVRDLPPMEAKILNMLTLEARTTDSLIVESGLAAPQVIGILTLLEMRALARRMLANSERQIAPTFKLSLA